jgi:manganese/zinc/iron transport system permease protein
MYEFWILITAALVATSCALVGSLLVLRRMSMLGDAISHSVLLGIVLVYVLFNQTSLHWMLAGAVLIGLLTAWASEWIHQKAKIPADASLGLVFTWLFALAIVLIAVFAEQVHLDHEHVLFGEMAFIPFNTLRFGELNLGPKAFWLALIVFIVNLAVILIGFERFKIASFHPVLATTLGIHIAGWHYLLMTLVSLTAVASFDVAGSVLVVAFLVIPAASAYLLAKSLKQMLGLSVVYALLSVGMGFGLASWLDSALSASMAASAGILLFATLTFNKWRLNHQAW